MFFVKRISPVVGTLAAAIIALGSVACGEDTVEPVPVTFLVDVSGETFRVRATEPETIASLEERRLSGERGVILGSLRSGDGGFNAPWSWHLDPATVEVADLAIEVCDGRPSMVEADTDYWIGTVGQFCPWGALVVSRAD